MAKLIGKIGYSIPDFIDDYFRIEPDEGTWNFPIYSYSKDVKKPVVIYRYNNYKIHSNIHKGMIYSRRLVDYCSMFIILDMNCGFIFKNNAYYPSRGDIIVLRDGSEFGTYFTSHHFQNIFEIDFPIEFFEYMNDNNIFSKLFHSFEPGSPSIISTNTKSYEVMEHKLSELEKAVLSEDENKDIIVWSYIIQVISLIYSQLAANKPSPSIYKISSKLRVAVDYMHENFAALDSIEDIAKECGITGTHLARMFKKVFFCTPNEYLTNLKISYSKVLLLQGMSIEDACYAAGFNNYTYFISKFKAVTGMTPSKFRENAK